MKPINTIEELILRLCAVYGNQVRVLDIMRSIDIPREEFEHYYHWRDDRYARNLLARTADFELLLICWEKGQESPIHDFNSQEAWIHPVVGKLREERFKINYEEDRLEQVSNVILGTSEFSYMNEVGIHRYSNAYEARSVSLNVYCKPVTQWKVYDELNAGTAEMTPWVTTDCSQDIVRV